MNKYTVEYADGYYIAKNGEGWLDIVDSENLESAQFVCDALNKAEEEKRK